MAGLVLACLGVFFGNCLGVFDLVGVDVGLMEVDGVWWCLLLLGVFVGVLESISNLLTNELTAPGIGVEGNVRVWFGWSLVLMAEVGIFMVGSWFRVGFGGSVSIGIGFCLLEVFLSCFFWLLFCVIARLILILSSFSFLLSEMKFTLIRFD